jgi:hypothetical protein
MENATVNLHNMVNNNDIKQLIQKLEKERGSKVICYLTSDKPAPQPLMFATQVALDILPLFTDILETFKKKPRKITLVIDTTGGNLDAPWPLVNLIREYCKEFEVIVLNKSLSAGTLVALGADRIVMSEFSQLSPVDPAQTRPDSNNKLVKLEVEDISSYIDFVKKKIGITEQSGLAEITKELNKEVPPTVVGSVNRTHYLIRRLSKNLLQLPKTKLADKRIDEIVEYLTEKLYSHRHFINRNEAKNIIGFGDVVEYSSKETKKSVVEMIKYFNNLLKIKETFDPIKLLLGKGEVDYVLPRAVVYSADIKYNFQSYYKITSVADPSGIQNLNINEFRVGWEIVK